MTEQPARLSSPSSSFRTDGATRAPQPHAPAEARTQVSTPRVAPHLHVANSESDTFRLAYAQIYVRGQSSGPWNRRPARLSPGESRPIDRALTTIPAAGFRRARKSPWPMASRTRRPKLRGSRRLVLPDQSAQFPQEQHRLTAPWRLLLAGRCGTEAGVRLGRRRLLSGKAWQARASREVNVPVEEQVPLVVLLVRVAPLSSWLTGPRQRPAARGAAASFPGLPPAVPRRRDRGNRCARLLTTLPSG
jgi:hypothetical protein